MNANDVLIAAWGIDLNIEKIEVGLNKSTWKVGQEFYLSSYKKDMLVGLTNEITIYRLLNTYMRKSSVQITCPTTIKTKYFENYFDDDTCLWKLAGRVKGEMPEPSHLALYPALACGLGHLHNALREVSAEYSPLTPSLIDDIERYVDLFKNSTRETFNLVEEYNLLEEATELIEKKIQLIKSQEPHLIHGDFSHPNLLIHNKLLVGVLDFEFASMDPGIMDLATLTLTLILRSGEKDIEGIIDHMIDAYNHVTDSSCDKELLFISMVMRKYDSYFYHRKSFLKGDSSEEIVIRQVMHLEALLDSYGHLIK